MFSNDNNVETFAQLVETLKHYVGLQKEYVKLDVIEKVVRLLTAIALIVVFSVLALVALFFISVGVAHLLEPCLGATLAYVTVGGGYIVLILLFLLNRRRLFERPLVKFLAELLLSK